MEEEKTKFFMEIGILTSKVCLWGGHKLRINDGSDLTLPSLNKINTRNHIIAKVCVQELCVFSIEHNREN